MSDTYSDLGQAIYDFIEAIDISALIDDDAPPTNGWFSKFNRPPKSDEVLYPGFAVMPVRDVQDIADSSTDSDTVTYAVELYASYVDASEDEALLRAIADTVRTKLRNERMEELPFGVCYAMGFTGMWGGNETQSERIYRIEITCRLIEQAETP